MVYEREMWPTPKAACMNVKRSDIRNYRLTEGVGVRSTHGNAGRSATDFVAFINTFFWFRLCSFVSLSVIRFDYTKLWRYQFIIVCGAQKYHNLSAWQKNSNHRFGFIPKTVKKNIIINSSLIFFFHKKKIKIISIDRRKKIDKIEVTRKTHWYYRRRSNVKNLTQKIRSRLIAKEITNNVCRGLLIECW